MIPMLEAAPEGGSLLGALASGGRVSTAGAAATRSSASGDQEFTGLLAAACAALGAPAAVVPEAANQTEKEGGATVAATAEASSSLTATTGETVTTAAGSRDLAEVVPPADEAPVAGTTSIAVGETAPPNLDSQPAAAPGPQAGTGTVQVDAAAAGEATRLVEEFGTVAAGARPVTASLAEAAIPAGGSAPDAEAAGEAVRVLGVETWVEAAQPSQPQRVEDDPAQGDRTRGAATGSEVKPAEPATAEVSPASRDDSASEPAPAPKTLAEAASAKVAGEQHPVKSPKPPSESGGQRTLGTQGEPTATAAAQRSALTAQAPDSGKTVPDGAFGEVRAAKENRPDVDRPATSGDRDVQKTPEWSANGARSDAAERSVAETPEAERPSARAEVRELPQIVRRAEVVARAGGPSEMRVQLVPEHLGRLSIRISVSEGGVTARLVVENSQVKSMVESRLPELEKALREQGLRLDGLSVGCQGSETDTGGFLRHQPESGLARSFAAGAARRGYEEGLPTGVPEGIVAGAGGFWPGDGGLINALV